MKQDGRAEKRESTSNDTWKQFFDFFRYGHLSWGWIIAAMILNMAYYLMVTKLPGSTAALFAGKFTKGAIMGVVTNYLLTLLLLIVVSIGSLLAQAKSVRSVRKAVWTRMMGIESKYYDQNGANYLLSAVTSDTEITVSTLMNAFITLPGLVMYLSQALPIINSFSPKLLWAILILIPVYIVYAVFMGRWQKKVGMRIQVRIGGLTGYLTDRIRNLAMVKSFATEQQEEEKGVDAAKKLYKGNLDYAYVNSVVVMYTLMAEVAGVVIAVIWGCLLLRNGEIDLESWLAFFLFAPTINTVFRQCTSMWTTLKEGQGRTARLGALMEAPQENMNDSTGNGTPTGDIQMKDVTFSYKKDLVSLQNVNLMIPAGKTTAIVGHSGSGKTTILRLLERLYVPQKGVITVGNKPLGELDLFEWREKLSYVTQGADLFGGTIREILTYGIHRTVTDKELEYATKSAEIYDFIMQQPQKFDSKLAIWGNTMSGGQRQRMVIARELLRNADILLLDEPTSALDAETAAAISNMIFKNFEGKTIVAVTHEIGFITNADQIVVMSEGKIIGMGNHKELMETNALYRELVEEQSYQEVFA